MNVRKFLSYKEAQEIVQKAGIKTQTEYYNWKERPSGRKYGTGFLSYNEAQKIIQQSGIRNSTEFRSCGERPCNIPAR